MTVFERVHMPLARRGDRVAQLRATHLGPAELRGHVGVVNFWTLTCINWLRQEPYVRAWSDAYRDDRLVVIGVHTPEFSFERELALVQRATKERGIDYPVAVDNDYEIRSGFATFTGRRCTSSTRTASSATSTSAKDATSSRSASPSGCSASSATRLRRRARRGGGSRLRPPAYARDVSRLLARRALGVTKRHGA